MKRWYLVVIAFNLVTATVAIVSLAAGAPRLPRLVLVTELPLFAMCCGWACFMGNRLGANPRTKAFMAIGFSWMLGGTLVGQGVRALFGQQTWWICVFVPPALLLVTFKVFRNWFRAGGSEARTNTDG